MTWVESQLYNQSYYQDSLPQRLERVEKTLFGKPQSGPEAPRVQRLRQILQAKKQHRLLDEYGPSLAYLERRIFAKEDPESPLEARVSNLELGIYGKKSDPQVPLATRLRRLMDGVPVSVRGVQLIEREQGSLIATTLNPKASPSPAAAAPAPFNPSSLPNADVAAQERAAAETGVDAPKARHTPSSPGATVFSFQKVISMDRVIASFKQAQRTLATPGDSYGAVMPSSTSSTQAAHAFKADIAVLSGGQRSRYHELPEEPLLWRWLALPIKVYTAATDDQQRRLVEEAIAAWHTADIPLLLIGQATAADIWIDWRPRTSFITTRHAYVRAVMGVDDGQRIRSVIHIDMTPWTGRPLSEQRHGVTHALGHALGIWTHSQQPDDVMTPRNKLEAEDLTGFVRYASMSSEASLPVSEETPWTDTPSVQERERLLRQYRSPGKDLSGFYPLAESHP
jgi:hypothetical protein